MALKIRLSRGGAKKRPFYRVVVADSRKPRDGRFIERIGSYNPLVPKDHPERFVINEDRAKHWYREAHRRRGPKGSRARSSSASRTGAYHFGR